MRVFSPFPLFHMAGIVWSLPVVTFIDSTIVLGTTEPLSVNLVDDVHTFGSIDYTSLPPSVITELCKRDTFIEKVKKLRGLTYAGGPLAQATGEMLYKHVSLYSDYGSTEMGAPPLLAPKPECWQYFKFNVEKSGFDFRPAGNDLYELVVVRKPDLDLFQAIFVTFPDLQEYHTKDLFSPHPTEPDLWKYASRRDDIIVYSSGEKVNPVTMEGTVSACPQVSGSVVVGAGRPESALLVEAMPPPTSDSEQGALLENIWPHIQRANDSAAGHARIAKDRVIFTTAKKPLARAGKGTVQRPGSLALYEQEIDELYDEPRKTKPLTSKMDLDSLATIVESLKKYIATEVGLVQVQPDTDFFKAGMDSVQVIELTRSIHASFGIRAIEPKQVYDCPTAEQLAVAIQMAKQGQIFEEDSDDDIHLEAWTMMQQKYYDLTTNFPTQSPSALRKYVEYFGTLRPLNLKGWRTKRKAPGDGKLQPSDECGNPCQCRKDHGDQKHEPRYLAASDKQFLRSMSPPDGGKTAWLQVLASFLLNVNVWGLIFSFGVYQLYYQQTLLPNQSATKIAWIGSVQAALLLIVGVLSGLLFDKGHFRGIILTAGLGLVSGLMMLSLATEYYQILLSQGVWLGICSGVTFPALHSYLCTSKTREASHLAYLCRVPLLEELFTRLYSADF